MDPTSSRTRKTRTRTKSVTFLCSCVALSQFVQGASGFTPIPHHERMNTSRQMNKIKQQIPDVPSKSQYNCQSTLNDYETSSKNLSIGTYTDNHLDAEVICDDFKEIGSLSRSRCNLPSKEANMAKQMVLSTIAAATIFVLLGSEGASATSGLLISSSNAVAGGLDWRYFVAGGGCAAFSHGVATPFDVIKTKMQAEPEAYPSGLTDTAMTLIKNDGPSALLAGLTPTLIGFGVEGGVKFGVYESLKPLFMSILGVGVDDKFIPYLAASVGAGAVASLMLVPMERARIKVVTSSSGENFGPVSYLLTCMSND